MFFSDKLRLLRTQANLSQEDLADELHVSRQSVSNGNREFLFQKSKNSFPSATIFMFPWMPC